MRIVRRIHKAERSNEHLVGLVSFILHFAKDWISGFEILSTPLISSSFAFACLS